jgi:hypothetical protein
MLHLIVIETDHLNDSDDIMKSLIDMQVKYINGWARLVATYWGGGGVFIYVQHKNFALQWRRSITGEGLQNLSICPVLKAFEQRGIFIMPHLQ